MKHKITILIAALGAAFLGAVRALSGPTELIIRSDYDNITDRAAASALIPEEHVNEIIKNAEEESMVLKLFRRVNISSAQQRQPVLASLPQAYFVTGDTGLKQTTEMSWTNKYLNVEEIAVIVPVPENVVDDVSFDLWGEAKPKIAEAIGRTLDAAVVFGTNRPVSWPAGIVPSAIAAGNVVTRGAAADEGGIAEDINRVMGTVEDAGFDVTGFFTSRSYRSRLRGARDTTGQKLLDVSSNTIEGERVAYGLRGLWPSAPEGENAELLAMDTSQFVCGVRKDINWKLLDQAVIQDASGNIIFNLAQQDMIAMRVTFRVAWQVANPITHERQAENERYPAGVLISPEVVGP